VRTRDLPEMVFGAVTSYDMAGRQIGFSGVLVNRTDPWPGVHHPWPALHLTARAARERTRAHVARTLNAIRAIRTRERA